MDFHFWRTWQNLISFQIRHTLTWFFLSLRLSMDFVILKFSPTLHFPIGTPYDPPTYLGWHYHSGVLWTFTFDELRRFLIPFRFVIHLLSSFFLTHSPSTLRNFTFPNFSLSYRNPLWPINLPRLTLPQWGTMDFHFWRTSQILKSFQIRHTLTELFLSHTLSTHFAKFHISQLFTFHRNPLWPSNLPRLTLP